MGGNVCFAELMQEFKHELGERNLSLGFDNLIVWAGMSKNVCAALLELNSENVMSFEKVESRTYMFAGSC